MFSSFFLKSFRILLLPFAVLYWIGVAIRNWCFDRGIFKSVTFGLPLICIGNLSVGGTGKSPMVEYLVRLLQSRFEVATLSRGYKRKTTGYALASDHSTALEIGDEPMQFHLKFPQLAVAVGEKRLEAIPQLLHDRPATQAIILDDAFQHRSIRAGLNILLTEYGDLYTRDFYLPTGDLRDQKTSYRRAQIIVVTKCPADLSDAERKRIVRELKPRSGQAVFFTSISYGQPYQIITHLSISLNQQTEVLLVSGIANPRPLKDLLEGYVNSYHMLQYSDHHIFTIDDLKDIRKRFKEVEAVDKIILTTEKDAVRLVKFNSEIADLPLYAIPIQHQFLFDEGDQFDRLIITFIRDFVQSTKN